jgi:DNA-binding MarR family transcriptional regulator/GNAT superfamily N-acetyltransferase
MSEGAVAQVRSFNRTVTQRVGALSDRYLARARPLGASRLLWEIGPDGCEVRALRARLGLDSGHVSRLLRLLEADGLVRTEPGARDRRVRVARLTRRGRAEWRLLDERSDALAASMLAPLGDDKRAELVSAMATVERLLAGAMVELRLTDPEHPDARACLHAYFAELNRRWPAGYDPAAGVSAEPDELRPPAGAFLVAYLHGEPVGCGGVKHLKDGPSDIKRMWVADAARGRGVARRLLAELEDHARRSGATVARLETNRVLTEAIALYRSAGYEEVAPFNDEPFAHHWFARRI